MLKNSKRLILLTVVFFMLSFQVDCNAGEIIQINQLIENAAAFDQTEVTIQGELIGEALERGENAWVNINDTTNAIGVWVTTGELDQIQYYGDYKNVGDTVIITGIYHKACTEHGGDVDIHCTSMEIVKQGHSVVQKVSLNKILVAVSLFAVMLAILTVYIKVIKLKSLKTDKKQA